MRNIIALVLALSVALTCGTVCAEALPSPDASALLSLSGDLRLSEAPMDIRVAECLRVDVLRIGDDGVWGDLTLPYVPPSIMGVALFDGFHLIYGVFQPIGETALRIMFWPEDVMRMDGTVGIYLVILVTEGE